MTDKERAFLIDLKQVLEKHQVYILATDIKDMTYHDGYGEPCFEFNAEKFDSKNLEELTYLDADGIDELLKD